MLVRLFFFFNIIMTALHAEGLKEEWTDYQARILAEHPKFNGWCPAEKAKHIMNILNNRETQVCVEVGVFGGSSFFPLVATLAYKQQGMAYAIDPWDNLPCLDGNYEDKTWNDKYKSYWGKVDLTKVMYKFIGDMHRNNLDANYVIMRMSSEQALAHFADESIDYLHIDGNHSEKSSVFDVTNWLPKVKKGGVICFDDAWWESTQKAVKLVLQDGEIMKESSPKWQYIFVKKHE